MTNLRKAVLTLAIFLPAKGAQLGNSAAAITVADFSRNGKLDSVRVDGSSSTAPVGSKMLAGAYGKLPLAFEANEGQADSRVRYLSRGQGYTLFLTMDQAILELHAPTVANSRNAPSGIVAATVDAAAPRSVEQQTRGHVFEPGPREDASVVSLNLLGISRHSIFRGVDDLPGKSNYFIGSDPHNWHTNIPMYSKVKYVDIYPGIDLVYYGHQGTLEYDYVVSPGADPGSIRFALHSSSLTKQTTRQVKTRAEDERGPIARIDANGDLVVKTGAKELRFAKPVVYQPDTIADTSKLRSEAASIAAKNRIEGSYVLAKKGEIGFSIPKYDRSKPLVIDPVLMYSTYLGGAGYDYGADIVVDGSGEVYVAGDTYSLNFPVTAGAFETTCTVCSLGGNDAFVTKLNAAGTALIYSTYLGSSSSTESQTFINSIALDSAGDAYLVGNTNSSTFPTTPGAFQSTCPQGCGFIGGFVTKLSPTGSTLAYSTYLSGSKFNSGYRVAVDSSQNAYVTGTTCASDFPVTSGSFQTTYGGGDCTGYDSGDAFVTKLNSAGSGLIFSTYLGGNSYDLALGLFVDGAANVYVAGQTASTNFPVTTGAFQTTCGGNNCAAYDAFVTKLDSSGSSLLYSTYLGGSNADNASRVTVDPSGNAFVTGGTDSADFPTTPGAFQTKCGGGCTGFNSDAFVTKLNPTGSALVYSTFIGGSAVDYAEGLAVDSLGNAYIAGSTDSSDYPVTPGAYQTTCDNCTSSAYDACVTELNANGTGLMYSSYLGGSGPDAAAGIALDTANSFYLTGYTGSTGFPVSPGAFQTTLGGNYDAFIAKFALVVEVLPVSLNFGDQQVGITSAPMNATLINGSTTTLNITSIVISGTNSPDFSQTNTCGTLLQPEQSCTISVNFTPSLMGAEQATLAITDDAENSPQSVALSGIGSEPGATLSPTSLKFPVQYVGGQTPPQTATLTNTGGVTLNIANIGASGNFNQTNTCGASLPPAMSCTISVRFRPKGKGSQVGSVTVSDNAPGSPQMVSLQGVGTFLQVSPNGLNYGKEKVGHTSEPQAIALTNVSQGTISISGVSISGTDPGDFAEQNTCGTSLNAGTTCFVVVTFTPTTAGPRTAQVLIDDNAGGSPQNVMVKGVGML